MSDLHKSDPDSPYADDLEFVRDYARRNDGYSLVQPVVDFINAHLAPPIIRTVEELEAIDRGAVLMGAPWHGIFITRTISADDLPAVVVATGAQVRAARKALGEA